MLLLLMELLFYVSGLCFLHACFSRVVFPNPTQANVVCVVYDVTDEDTINKVKTRQQASLNLLSHLPSSPESETFCLVTKSPCQLTTIES